MYQNFYIINWNDEENCKNSNKKRIIFLKDNTVFSKNLYVEEKSNKINRSNKHNKIND